ncbi:MarR family winged helix-turn-helix transcriptional regulator [Aureimonas glaciei]|uniref:Transcriptional regulator n=1 Tax=Aureimonas glaciei TaxID=1776957 RepID=A0A917DEW9_9HYPH|nr:MarR family winged helix-turn-helix transcriptional regulator [Aureimonas glaciei]GGD31391.1 transcriptional regulator [Aureimonas glaciei]
MSEFIARNSLDFIVGDVSRLLRHGLEELIGEAQLQITPGEFRMLHEITFRGPERQCDLAAVMGVEPMTVSALLVRMEQRKLITRIPDPEDRRAKLIASTATGRDLLEKVKLLAQEVIAHATRGLGPAETRNAEAALHRMRMNLVAGW